MVLLQRHMALKLKPQLGKDLLHLQMLEDLKETIQEGKLTDTKSMKAMCKLQNCKGALKDLDEFLDAFKAPTSS